MRIDRNLFPVALLSFVNMLGFAVMLPVLPFIVEQYGHGELMYGLLLSSYSLFQFLAAPIIGSLSDQYGRRPLLILSQAGTLASWVVFAVAYFTPDIVVLGASLPILVILFSRVVDGITGGNISVATAYAIDITPEKKRSQMFGFLGAVMGVALVIGPVLGSFSSAGRFGYLGTVLLAGAVSLFTLSYLHDSFVESRQLKNTHKPMKINWKLVLSEINIIQKMMEFRRNPRVLVLFFIRILFSFAFFSYTSIVVLYVIDLFNFTQIEVGYFMFAIGIFLIFNQGLLVKKFVARYGDVKTFFFGQILMACGFFFITLPVSLWVYLVFTYIINLGFSLSSPTLQTMVSNRVSEDEQGVVSGIQESIGAFVRTIVPFTMAIFYSWWGGYSFYVLVGLVVFTSLMLAFRNQARVFISSRTRFRL